MKTSCRPVIVDTNILFSALLTSRSLFAETLLATEHDFFVCEMVLVELFKHKDRVAAIRAA